MGGAKITTPLPGCECGAELVRIKLNVHVYACMSDIYGLLSISDQRRASICVYNRSYVLAIHERLPVQMGLSTAETDVSSAGNNFTQIERWCRGSNDDCMDFIS